MKKKSVKKIIKFFRKFKRKKRKNEKKLAKRKKTDDACFFLLFDFKKRRFTKVHSVLSSIFLKSYPTSQSQLPYRLL